METMQSDTLELEYDVGANEKEEEVLIPEGPASEPESAGAPEEKENHRSELEAVSEAVQKRISKLTSRMREAERREQAAVDYAKGLQTQSHQLQRQLVNTDYSRLSEAKTRLDTQQATLKSIIRKAREEGDIDTETEAQERLTDLIMEQRNVASWLQTQANAARQYEEAPQQQYAQPQQQYAPQQRQPQPAQPSPKAEDWATRNSWFGQDRMMTYAAWGIHQSLIEDEGIDADSDDYYTELDRRMRDEFPRRFSGESQPNHRAQRHAPAVAPASRSSGVNSARRSVRLSPSQVAIAKKLGVPLEEYAKYVKE